MLDNGAVRCWGFGGNGRLGNDAIASIGDDPGETPASAGPVAFGAGRTARAITVGFSHSCALLDDGTLRCWGFGGSGRLGYGNEDSVGDDPARSVAAAGPVPVGAQVAPIAGRPLARHQPATVQLALGATATDHPAGRQRRPRRDAGRRRVPAPARGAGLPRRRRRARAPSTAPAARGRSARSARAPSASLAGHGGRAPRPAPTRSPPRSPRRASSTRARPRATAGAEDDRGVATFAVPATGGAGGRQSLQLTPRCSRISVARKPKKGRVKTLTVSGRLVLPRVRPAPRCTGKVRVRALAGKRVLASRTVRAEGAQGRLPATRPC